MRRHDDRGTAAVGLQEKTEDLLRGGRIQIARRLVCQDETGATGESPRHGHPLLLPSRQSLNAMARLVPQAHLRQSLVRPSPDLSGGQTEDPKTKGHVVQSRAALHQAEILEYGPQYTAQALKRLAATVRKVTTARRAATAPLAATTRRAATEWRAGTERVAVDPQLSVAGSLLPQQQAEEGGLTRPTFPQQEYELSLLYLQVNTVQGPGPIGIYLTHGQSLDRRPLAVICSNYHTNPPTDPLTYCPAGSPTNHFDILLSSPWLCDMYKVGNSKPKGAAASQDGASP